MSSESGIAPHPGPMIMRAPTYIRRLFDAFPLVTRPSLGPTRAPSTTSATAATASTSLPILYGAAMANITESSAESGYAGSKHRQSVLAGDPASLTWLTFLRMHDMPVRFEGASKHASPNKVLPFVHWPHRSKTYSHTQLNDWVGEYGEHTGATPPVPTGDIMAFLDLVNSSLHDAYLFAKHIDGGDVVSRAAWPVNVLEDYEDRKKAKEDILLSRRWTTLDGDEIYADARGTWDALQCVLSPEGNYLLGQPAPTLLDASFFAYAHLILSAPASSSVGASQLAQDLRGRSELVEYAQRLFDETYGVDRQRSQ